MAPRRGPEYDGSIGIAVCRAKLKKPSRWVYWLGPFALALLLAWTPTDDGPTICPFALLTGHACPGCGMTRALAYLVRGDFDRALLYHPLAPVLTLVGIAGLVWLMGRRRGSWPSLSVKTINVALSIAGALLLGVWLTRIATGTLPPV